MNRDTWEVQPGPGVGVYGRVSTDGQEKEQTVQSQLTELREKVRSNGYTEWEEFVDEGYSRDNLDRPGLDRLRDAVRSGLISRIYIQAPDRLGSGSRFLVVYEEFLHAGATVTFLTGDAADTPEGKLLLHMHSAFAEYEHTKITERTRRGKLYWARQGSLTGFVEPYGYRFVKRSEQKRAHLCENAETAPVVRMMFRWLIDGKLSTRAIALRLTEMGIATARGGVSWKPSAVQKILKNEVYTGVLRYMGRSARSAGRDAESGTVEISVPELVSKTDWEQAQRQLEENSRFSTRNRKRHRYLLSGLGVCPRCSGAYVGHAYRGTRTYRCNSTDRALTGPKTRCTPGQVSADRLESTVWGTVDGLIRTPSLLREVYEGQQEGNQDNSPLEQERTEIAKQIAKLKKEDARLLKAYTSGLFELKEVRSEKKRISDQMEALLRREDELARSLTTATAVATAFDRFDAFSRRIAVGLDALTFEERQRVVRLLVNRVIPERDRVRIEVVVPPSDESMSARLRPRHPELVEGWQTPLDRLLSLI